jgi:truncated hemoglobin YjbI
MTAAERREKITAEIAAATGITEAMIERLVRGFYAKVRSDPALAPIFDARIQNWEPHLQKMCAFWSSVTLMSGRYHGTPMVKHMPLPVDACHFDRWLELRPPRASFVHRRLLRISSNARGGSRRAWNSGSQMRTASCPASAKGFGVTEEEPPHAPPNQRRD